MASDLAMLILFRALQGLGGGGLNSLVVAITGDLVPPRQRAKYQAVTGMGATVALIAGPLLGGAFSDGLSWRWVLYINVPIGIAAFLAVGAWLHLPGDRTLDAARRGAERCAAGTAAADCPARPASIRPGSRPAARRGRR